MIMIYRYNYYVVLCLFLLACSKDKSISDFSAEGKRVDVYTTSSSSNLRLTKTASLIFVRDKYPVSITSNIIVNPSKTYQTFLGMGGSITDASAEVFATLPINKQEELLKAYYSPIEGIGYTLARTSIHSCDFSSQSYTYVDEGDKDLLTFNIDHDKAYRIPLIKKANNITGGKLKLYASPWSPPAFMKDNNNMLRGGKLLAEYKTSWANYFTKFIKLYEKEGVPVWGITIQNEPMAIQRWESCVFTSEEERDFLKQYLGPIMNTEGLGDKKIIVWDHNRDAIVERANVIFNDPEASKYAWGIGFHWYEAGLGGNPMFSNIRQVHEQFPSKNLLFTEGCAEFFNETKLQYWPNAERYGNAIINDFNNGTVGWTDWNILLDEKGGPNHFSNYCFAPIHANTKNGELIYTPSYYYLGHFSKFIRPNAKRISMESNMNNLLFTSFINEDGKIVSIVMNQTNESIKYKIKIGNCFIEENAPAHGIQTLVY